MAAIIGVHTLQSYGTKIHAGAFPDSFNYLLQPIKFGTLTFFLVAGFLFGERIDYVQPGEYFLRRLRTRFLPWCFWVSLWCVVRITADLLYGNADLDFNYLTWVVKFYATEGTYWFIPNLLIALAILLVLRRFLRDIRVGLLFLGASLFYSVNIYGRWITVVHTHAVFGYVFHLWLGAWAAWHFEELKGWLKRIPAVVMIAIAMLSLCLAAAETTLLIHLGSVEPSNTLCVTNQIYSVVLVLALLKLKGAVWPRFVQVREHTYGLYLVHTFAVSFFVRAIYPVIQYLAGASRWVLWAGSIVMLPLMYAMVYGGSLLLVRTLLSYPKLRWTVGTPLKKTAKLKMPGLTTMKPGIALRPNGPGIPS